MSILGSSNGLFMLDGQGAIISSSDLQVNGWLRASGRAELYGGVHTPQVVSSQAQTSNLVVNGPSLFNGGVTGQMLTLTGGAGLHLNDGVVALNHSGVDTGLARGLRYLDAAMSDYAGYVCTAGAGKSTSGGRTCQGGAPNSTEAFSGYAMRNRVSASTTRGWIWENSLEECAFSVRSDGHAYVRQSLNVGGPILLNGTAVATTLTLDGYLSKPEFDSYNLQETLKEVAQAVFNAAVQASLDQAEAAIQIFGASLISGTFTLGGILVQNVDDAFLNLDGRLISVGNSLTMKANLDYVDANLALKADTGSLLSVGSIVALVDARVGTLETSKASVTYVDTLVGTKASTEYVDAEITQALTQAGGTYHNSVNIISGSLSDSFILNTDNVSGELEIHCTPAYNVTSILSQIQRTTPWINTDNTTPQYDTVWPDSVWLTSAVTNTTLSHRAIFGTNTYWQHTTQTYNNAVPAGVYWQIQFPVAVLISSLQITGAADAQGNPIGFWLKSSTTGTSFTNVQFFGTTNNVASWWPQGEVREFYVTASHVAARFWRIEVTNIGYTDGSSRSGPCLRNVQFTTTGIFGTPTFLSALPIDYNSFKIVLVDGNIQPISMTTTTVAWKFTIMITKGGKLVSSGLYQLSNDRSSLVITKISPTAATITAMSALGEGEVPEEIVPAPTGTIIMYAGLSAPNGYFVCDGMALSRTAYAALFTKIGIVWGAGNGTTTFNLPDLRNRFLRMTGDAAGEVGTRQQDSIKSHTHSAQSTTAGAHTHTIDAGGGHTHSGRTSYGGSHRHQIPQVNNSGLFFGNNSGSELASNRQGYDAASWDSTTEAGGHEHTLSVGSAVAHTHGISTVVGHTHQISVNLTGDLETRPLAASVMYCIKF